MNPTLMPTTIRIVIICTIANAVAELATDNFMFVKTWPDGGIYQMTLNGTGVLEPSLVVDGSDATMKAGFAYDNVTRSVVWSVGNIIKRLSIDEGTTTVLLDLSSRSELTGIVDMDTDPTNENIFFVVGGILGMIENGEYTREIYNGVEEAFVSIAFDHMLPKVFGILRYTAGATYKIMKLNTDVSLMKRSVDDSPTQVIYTGNGSVYCISLDIHEQFVYWSDGNKIYRTDYNGNEGQATFYVDTLSSSIRDIAVVDKYIYYVGKDNLGVMRVHKHDNTSETSIGPEPGLSDMNWLDVYIAKVSMTEVMCSTEDIVHVTLPVTCSLKSGEECNDFVCDSGYEKNSNVTSLTCTDSGVWSHNLSTICIATTTQTCSKFLKTVNCTGSWYHHHSECPFEVVAGEIVVTIAELLSDSCVYYSGQFLDYDGNDLVYGYTNSKIWIYNGCEAIFQICSASAETCPAPDSEMLGFLCDSVCPQGSCGNGEICCDSDICGDNVCVLPLEAQVPDADGCPYAPALYGICGSAVYCADHNDCATGLVCCYSYECGDNVCVTPGQTDISSPPLVPPKITVHVPSFMIFVKHPFRNILCTGVILNGALPESCQSKAGESCDSFTCDAGYTRQEGVTELHCSESGEWSSDLSSLCVEVSCPWNIGNGHLSDNCSTEVNSTCDTILCDDGHTRNDDVVALVCTGAGTWDYEVSFQCGDMASAINCRVTPPTGTLLKDWIDELGNSCGYSICNENYKSEENNHSVVCMSNEILENYHVIKCSASECSGGQSIRFSLVQVPWVCLLVAITVTGMIY